MSFRSLKSQNALTAYKHSAENNKVEFLLFINIYLPTCLTRCSGIDY